MTLDKGRLTGRRAGDNRAEIGELRRQAAESQGRLAATGKPEEAGGAPSGARRARVAHWHLDFRLRAFRTVRVNPPYFKPYGLG